MAELLCPELLPQQGQSIPVQQLGLPWVPLGLWEEPLRSNHITSNLSAPCPSPALPYSAYVSIKVQSQALEDTHSSHRENSKPHGIAITSPHALLKSTEILF